MPVFAIPRDISRRSFLNRLVAGLATLGARAGLFAAGETFSGCSLFAPEKPPPPLVKADGRPRWTPIACPVPLSTDGGTAETDPSRLASFIVQDTLILPPEFSFQVIASWGDVFGPADDSAKQVRVGYNCAFCAIVPRADLPRDIWLVINHEYVSARPWMQAYKEVCHAELPAIRYQRSERVFSDGPRTVLRIGDTEHYGNELYFTDFSDSQQKGLSYLQAIRTLAEKSLEEVGVTVLHAHVGKGGQIEIIADSSDHKRITATARHNVSADAALRFSGPAKSFLPAPRGALACASGSVTPWGTVLSCEGSFDAQVRAQINPDGELLAGERQPFTGVEPDLRTGYPLEWHGLGTALDPPLDGRTYGWVCEVDPQNGSLIKHSALGRFRHNNISICSDAGRPLVCYMADDRPGGHVWRFVSSGVVTDASAATSSALLERGTLEVARFEPEFTGRWIPLLPETPLATPLPSQCVSRRIILPNRPLGGIIAVTDEPAASEKNHPATLPAAEWIRSVERFAGRGFSELSLRDLVGRTPFPKKNVRDEEISAAMAVLLLDCFPMANAIGGTPTPRPGDIERNPRDGSLFIAFTNSLPDSDSSPDRRIFPDAAGPSSRRFGSIYRIADTADPRERTFTWNRFAPSGEMADGGSGFACPHDMAFDGSGAAWVASCTSVNSKRSPAPALSERAPAKEGLPGVFGNSAMMMLPTWGAHAGSPFCFAIGPVECELAGCEISADNSTMLLCVQHPGELNGIRQSTSPDQPATTEEQYTISARDGRVFTQERSVPIGSNFPNASFNQPPKPTVVGITRLS